MGWFDEESSEDETSISRPGLIDLDDDLQQQKQQSSVSGSAKANDRADGASAHQAQNDESDEVDPLDAFMVGIGTRADQDAQDSKRRAHEMAQSSPSSGSVGAGAVDAKHRRLDVDNEEEATAHWTDRPVDISGGDSGHKRLLPANGEAAAAAATTEAAAASFDYTKSAAKDDVAAAIMKHQEVDPLANIDHQGVQYNAFERKFYVPADTELGKRWREDNEVSCSLNVDPLLRFEDIASGAGMSGDINVAGTGVLQGEIMAYLQKCGFLSPTLVQAQAIPFALSGHDCIVTAATGSGKTLSYALPLTVHCIAQEHINPGVDGPIGLVLTPTRELAAQVHKQCNRLLRTLDGRAVCVTGGNRGTYELSKDLRKGCEVIVSTPGRLIDLVRAKATNLQRVTMIVLDEADRMLDMGFEKQVTSIMNNVRPDRHTLMFSATFGRRVERVAREWLVDPVRISIGRTGVASEHVSQHVIVLPNYHSKKQWMMEMLPTLARVGRMIVFVSSRADCEDLARAMQSSPSVGGRGLKVDSIHGDKHQVDRNAALSALRKGNIAALIATDVAARGLDVEDIMTVVNFDCAKNFDAHVHRVGRAGRMSAGGESKQKKGVAYTLLTPKNADFANLLFEAFVREGRHVGDDLAKLARESKHFGNKGHQQVQKRSSNRKGNAAGTALSYYGPATGLNK